MGACVLVRHRCLSGKIGEGRDMRSCSFDGDNESRESHKRSLSNEIGLCAHQDNADVWIDSVGMIGAAVYVPVERNHRDNRPSKSRHSKERTDTVVGTWYTCCQTGYRGNLMKHANISSCQF